MDSIYLVSPKSHPPRHSNTQFNLFLYIHKLAYSTNYKLVYMLNLTWTPTRRGSTLAYHPSPTRLISNKTHALSQSIKTKYRILGTYRKSNRSALLASSWINPYPCWQTCISNFVDTRAGGTHLRDPTRPETEREIKSNINWGYMQAPAGAVRHFGRNGGLASSSSLGVYIGTQPFRSELAWRWPKSS